MSRSEAPRSTRSRTSSSSTPGAHPSNAEMASIAAAHGWRELFAEKYPHAGGDEHTALYLENSEGFEVEVVVEP